MFACHYEGQRLSIGYFNADKRADMICHDESRDAGQIYIYIAQESSEILPDFPTHV